MEHIKIETNFDNIVYPQELLNFYRDNENVDAHDSYINQMLSDPTRIDELVPHIKWFGENVLQLGAELECVHERYQNRTYKAIEHNNFLGLEWQWASYELYGEWYPDYESHLIYASHHGSLEMFQHVLYQYAKYVGADESTDFVSLSTLLDFAKQNKDQRVHPYILSLKPLVNQYSKDRCSLDTDVSDYIVNLNKSGLTVN